MANVIYLEWGAFGSISRKARKFPLMEDPTIELQSDFENLADMMPNFISGILDMVQKGDQWSRTTGDTIQSMYTLPLWKRTQPVKLNVKLLFYAKSGTASKAEIASGNLANKKMGEGDVFLPVMEICSQAILRRITYTTKKGSTEQTTRYTTPGVSFSDVKNLAKASKGKRVEIRNVNYVSIEIPGVIYLPIGLIRTAKPTFSKETTEDNYPLWATVDLEIQSAMPANDMILKRSAPLKSKYYKTIMEGSSYKKQRETYSKF